MGQFHILSFTFDDIEWFCSFTGTFFAALFLLLIQFAECSVMAAFVMITLAVGLSGFTVVGFEINHIDIAPQFAGMYVALLMRWYADT